MNMDAISLPKDDGAGPDDVRSPRGMNRLLGLFNALALQPEGMTLARLSVALGSPKSSLLTLLRPLTAQGYLIHKDGRYALGPEIYWLASNIISSRKFSSLVRPIMEELMVSSGETVIVATLDRSLGMIIYQDVVESTQAIRYVVPAGEARVLYASAGGRLMLAYQDEAWREAYLANTTLKALTDATVTDAGMLREILADIRRSGISVSMGQAVVGASGFAAPVFDAQGTILAALIIGAPEMRGRLQKDKISKLIVEAAARVSRALGYNPAGNAELRVRSRPPKRR